MNAIDRSLELLTLKQVFAEGRRSFAIPDFQRGYSWEVDQRADLLRDIEYGLSGNYSHYGGTLVAVKNHSIQDFDHFEIVDGQQRLTTLIILLSCIAHTFDRFNRAAPEDLRRCFIEEGSDRGSTRRKFQLSDEQDPLFWQMINEPDSIVTIKNKGHQNIVDAFDQLQIGIGFTSRKTKRQLTKSTNTLQTASGLYCMHPKTPKKLASCLK